MRTIPLGRVEFDIPCTSEEWELNDPTGLAAPELTAALSILLMEVNQRLKEGYSLTRQGVMTLYERHLEKVVARYVSEDDFDPRSVALFYIDQAVARLT